MINSMSTFNKNYWEILQKFTMAPTPLFPINSNYVIINYIAVHLLLLFFTEPGGRNGSKENKCNGQWKKI